MKLKHLLPTFLLLFSCHTFIHAQKYYNKTSKFLKANSVWAFGVNAGLDFNNHTNGNVSSLKTANGGWEGFASVSDPITGKLLFYTNGISCFNANHQPMLTRYNLLLGSNRNTTAQGALIIPVIDSPGKYYLFSLVDGDEPITVTGLYYSIVDMSLDNGMGGIDPRKKNILLDNEKLTEGMIAIPGDNCDIWLMVHSYTKPEFKTYHITKEGIDTVPVISNRGGTFQSLDDGYVGTLAISSDRSKVALANYSGYPFNLINCGLTIGKFDPNTGSVSSTIELAKGLSIGGAYGCVFSPDNSKLYASFSTAFDYSSDLYQYEVGLYDSLTIVKSKTRISNLPTVSYLKLYNDTIYLSNSYGKPTIHRMNQPNLSGAACSLQIDAVSLLNNDTVMTGSGVSLNTDVVYPIRDTVFNKMDTIVCSGWETGNFLKIDTAFDYYLWNTGDTTAQIHVSIQGQSTYWVNYGDDCHKFVDSFKISIVDMFTTITVNGFELGTTGGPFSSYQWLLNGVSIPGATSSIYTVRENGNYQVVITNEYGCSYTSDVYPVTNFTSIADVNTLSNQIRIFPNPAKDILHIQSPFMVNVRITDMSGKLIKEQAEASSITLSELAKGIYLLHISGEKGALLKAQKLVKVE